MAKNNNLSDFLTGVADAIRAKKGTSGLINPQDFESNIESISASKEEQEKSVEITQNGTIVVLPDSGKVLSKVTITVNVEKEPQEYTDCITFTGETSDFTLKTDHKEWDGTVEYSTNRTTWTTWNGTAISSSNKKLYLRGSGNTTFCTDYGARFVLSAHAGCSGNLNTLLEYSNPPVTLSAKCYRAMFYDCTNLTSAPALPATTLADECYAYMFRGCKSLITAPELPATTLANNCYAFMFGNCRNLITAPALPATTLATECYQYMFYDCVNLKVSSSKTGSYQYAWRIPTSGTISSTAVNWNNKMLGNTGGTFTSNPSINTTYYGAWYSEG